MYTKTFLLMFIFLASLLQADYILKYNMDGEKMTFMYKNDKTSKMITHSEDGKLEVYHIKKNAYIVTYTQDGITVIDAKKLKAQADAMKKQAAQMGFDVSSYEQEPPMPNMKFKIKKTGKRKKVAGINGQVWLLQGKENGKSFSEKVVVTDRAPVVRAVHGLFKTMEDMGGEDQMPRNYLEPRKGFVIIQAEGMTLESFASKSVPSKEYRVPKATNTRENWDKRNRAEASNNKKSKKKELKRDKPSCYKNLCCGNIAGESVVLKASLPQNKGAENFRLIDSATCVKGKREDAIYESRTTGARIYVSLLFNDKHKGTVKKAHKYNKRDYMRNFKEGKVHGYSYAYAVYLPHKEETIDVFVDKGATITFTRLEKEKISSSRSLPKLLSYGDPHHPGLFKLLSKNLKKYNPNKKLAKRKSYTKNYKNKVCNGKKAGKSKILSKYVHKKATSAYRGFTLFDVAKCKQSNLEEAIFIRNHGREVIKVQLNTNDKRGGVIKHLKNVSHSSRGTHIVRTYSAIVKKTDMAYVEYIVDKKITFNISRKIGNSEDELTSIDMYGPLDISGLIYHFRKDLKREEAKNTSHKKATPKKKERAPTLDVSDDAAKEAAQMFKSFF